MRRNLHLLIIDPQNDFCDLPAAYLPDNPAGGGKMAAALPVPGAHADMLRVADLINRGGGGIDAISITLDSHHRLDIAHPGFWTTAAGNEVTPFTQISAAEVRAGSYLPRLPAALPRVLHYLDRLEAAGRYRLMVWPVHCEIGSWGHNVHADVRAAYNRWEEQTLRSVGKVGKGSNPWTEHYSAVQAEVPDPDDVLTQSNQAFLDSLAQADCIYITGEAGSHCVKATTEHIADHFGPENMGKLVLVTDCMSPVTGFKEQYRKFIADMAARGARIANAADVLLELSQ
ncbi:cysteine hydrolase [Collimonas sp. OK412]|jgi:nicotinamidase-related amidase|uniref:cysteine hydrolase n=1 Tax=Collimonas sp. (strain OK412) TaxID=1801619 RepID=UPI0008E92B40|nr:cysteine hydrolase [Collimonas sp. OK412]SFD18428.1 Nicotinamidase-related amidase [Collimonas sp. OK412]